MSQQPDAVRQVPLRENGQIVRGSDGRPVMTREYDFTLPDGRKVTIQEHSAGHSFGEGGVGDQGPHFNLRESGTNKTFPGAQEHYYFQK